MTTEPSVTERLIAQPGLTPEAILELVPPESRMAALGFAANKNMVL